MSGDSKQRKRRGNLPKETTDKLRTWFMAHLSHPYPTEDEKQELMRQTGLQMSKSTPTVATSLGHGKLTLYPSQTKYQTGSSTRGGVNCQQ